MASLLLLKRLGREGWDLNSAPLTPACVMPVADTAVKLESTKRLSEAVSDWPLNVI